MISKAMMRRIEALESFILSAEDEIAYVLVRVVDSSVDQDGDRSRDGTNEPPTDDAIVAVTIQACRVPRGARAWRVAGRALPAGGGAAWPH